MTTLDTTTEEKPLRKNLTRCPACGKAIAKTRKVPHPETVECKSTLVHRALSADGLVRAGNWGATIRAAGFPVKRVACQPGTQWVPTWWGGKPGRSELQDILLERDFAPREAVRAAHRLMGLALKPATRAALVRALVERPALYDEIGAAFDTVARLGGQVCPEAWAKAWLEA